jgi:hypothetical protein
MAARPLPEVGPVPVITDVCGDNVTVSAGQTITWQNHHTQAVNCAESPANQANWPLTVTSWTVPAAVGSMPGTQNTTVKSNAPSNALGCTFSRSAPPCTNGIGKIITQ